MNNDGDVNRSDVRAGILPSGGVALADWLGAGSVLLLVASALLHALNPLVAALITLPLAGALWSHRSHSRQLWEELLRLSGDKAELERQLAGEKQSTTAIHEAAQADERAKSAFISNISHELRTPLNAMIGMAQLLERSELAKEQRDRVKVLLESSRGLKTLLDDIIALSQNSGESLSSPEDGCDAGQAARTVARLLQPNAWEKRLRLTINVEPGLPRVAADPRLLRRVLLKLVGNALKFTERGKVEINLDATAGADGAPRVRCAITDSGPGIPGDFLAAVFEPFTKQDNSYATRHGGAGVGLAVAKRLVESIGGTIGVESEPGLGASFWITVPAATAVSHDEWASDEKVQPPSGLMILAFVSTDEARSTLDRLLTPFGNSVVHAETLAQAVTMSARGGYSVIIAAAASVAALAATPGQHTPILALVAADEASPDGADATLRWPSAASGLFAAVSNLTGDTDRPANHAEAEKAEAAIDAKAFSDLEKSLGIKTLIDILQSYLVTAETLAQSLTVASEKQEWTQAARLAQDFAGAAGGLGLSALTTAARALAQSARDGANTNVLSIGTNSIIAEHTRVREALRRLYPDLAA